jgi:hypothetical protein
MPQPAEEAASAPPSSKSSADDEQMKAVERALQQEAGKK